jgi:hypothetical protein
MEAELDAAQDVNAGDPQGLRKRKLSSVGEKKSDNKL